MARRCAYLFPGQGSQYVGMGYDLADNYPSARDVFAQADRVLGVLLSELCYDGPAEALNDTVNTQPAILAASVAALRVLEGNGLEAPAYVAGHSMGELSALVASGALSFEAGLNLVRERGRLMKEAGERNPGGMAAVLGLGREELEDVCAEVREKTGAYVGVANDNCPGQIVISGATTALKLAMVAAQERGAKRAIRLAVSIAAHSPLMAEAAEVFRQRLDETPLREPKVPIIANAIARPLSAPDDIREALAQQLTCPVRWTESMEWALSQGVECFVEVGPKNVLTNLLRRIDRSAERITTEEALTSLRANASPPG
ncbi:MAG: ACP S-malonyltransferase [Anaerolineae bacterium]